MALRAVLAAAPLDGRVDDESLVALREEVYESVDESMAEALAVMVMTARRPTMVGMCILEWLCLSLQNG